MLKTAKQIAEETHEEIDASLEPLRQKWKKKFAKLYGPPPPRLPPIREVNHTIQLIDLDKKYTTRPPKCSAAHFPLLREKMQRYLAVGWWKLANGRNALPLLAIPKAGAELNLQTVIDARERNTNTILDSTPLPNQDMIWEAVVSHKYTSIIDMTDAYEQMQVIPEDVPKTLFASPQELLSAIAFNKVTVMDHLHDKG